MDMHARYGWDAKRLQPATWEDPGAAATCSKVLQMPACVLRCTEYVLYRTNSRVTRFAHPQQLIRVIASKVML